MVDTRKETPTANTTEETGGAGDGGWQEVTTTKTIKQSQVEKPKDQKKNKRDRNRRDRRRNRDKENSGNKSPQTPTQEKESSPDAKVIFFVVFRRFLIF